MRERAEGSTAILALVAAARVAVGAAMILAPSRIFSPGSGTETLLMRTIGIRDVVLGSGACAAWARGEEGECSGGQRSAWLVMEQTLLPAFAARRSSVPKAH